MARDGLLWRGVRRDGLLVVTSISECRKEPILGTYRDDITGTINYICTSTD